MNVSRETPAPRPRIAVEYDVPVTEQELAGLRLRRPMGRPPLRVTRREDGAMLMRTGELDRWALEVLLAWRQELPA